MIVDDMYVEKIGRKLIIVRIEKLNAIYRKRTQEENIKMFKGEKEYLRVGLGISEELDIIEEFGKEVYNEIYNYVRPIAEQRNKLRLIPNRSYNR